MNENKIKVLIYLCILTFFVSISFLVFYFTNKPEDPDSIHTPIHDQYVYSDIYDVNEYQTIYNCIRNYYSIINENQGRLLDLLYEEYKNRNNINLNTIINYVEKKQDSFSYSITEIKKFSNIYYSIYYVVGEYSLESLEMSLEKNIVKDILIEDVVNGTYAILPILNIGVSFEKIIEEYKFSNYDKSIIKNNENLLINGTMNDFNEAMLYLSDFVKHLIDNCSEAYSLLGNETKKEYVSLNSFRNYCSYYQKEHGYVSPTIINYKASYENGMKNIMITDNYHNKYQFFIRSVKDYKVDIVLK